MIACNQLDDQSISKLLMKSTSKNIASCDYKIASCDYKIASCDYKAIFAFDLMTDGSQSCWHLLAHQNWEHGTLTNKSK